jgi:hypothetical protein
LQQEEQLILNKLVEAREAQARAMTRFMQARERMVAVETRLHALRSRPATSQTLSASSPEIGTTSSEGTKQLDADAAKDISLAKTSALLTNEADVLSQAETTTLPNVEADKPASEEDTKKLQALPDQLKQVDVQGEQTVEQATAPFPLATPDPTAEASTSPQSLSDEATAAQDTNATDITTKIPVIRREDRPCEEPQEKC